MKVAIRKKLIDLFNLSTQCPCDGFCDKWSCSYPARQLIEGIGIYLDLDIFLTEGFFLFKKLYTAEALKVKIKFDWSWLLVRNSFEAPCKEITRWKNIELFITQLKVSLKTASSVMICV